MICAELSHNPYLLQTSVKFNGHEPRINCQIEKYQDKQLSEWVTYIPEIFYEEMNGYDFDLNFIGTKSDFEEVVRAFQAKGVTSDQVRIFHKNEMEDTSRKSTEIINLLKWLELNPNRKFDYEGFRHDNTELFDEPYPYFMIGGTVPSKCDPKISIERVENADELQNVSLACTPVVIYIDNLNRKTARKDLKTLLSRADIKKNQLFFTIHPGMDTRQVTRVISDLGVEHPQIIQRYDDDVVMKYMRDYPITQFVRKSIKAFSNTTEKISAILTEENKNSVVTNAETREAIDALDSDIDTLNNEDEFFTQRDKYEAPSHFQNNLEKLIFHINDWKKKKVKILSESEAEDMSDDYDDYLQQYCTEYGKAQSDLMIVEAARISDEFHTAYAKAGIDAEYHPDNIQLSPRGKFVCPEVKADLMTICSISYEQPQDFFGFFKKQDEQDPKLVRVTTYYMEEWRKKASELILPVAKKYMKECSIELENYYNSLADAYHSHLVELIADKGAKKEQVTSELTDDERKLQDDNDWLKEFQAQLQVIERA